MGTDGYVGFLPGRPILKDSIYENASTADKTSGTMLTNKSNTKHILAVLEIKKMIPVPNKYYSKIDFKTITDTSYRDLIFKAFGNRHP